MRSCLPRSGGVEAFARVAAETQAFEVVGPPLSESDPLMTKVKAVRSR